MSWTVGISGTAGEPEGDKLTLTHDGSPKVFLDIGVPGIRSAGEDQQVRGRQAIRDVLVAIQEALDSPSALAGFRP